MKFLRPTHHETFNVLKTNGYNLEHNFGHGKKTLASVMVVLNLLAFTFHTAAYLGVLARRTAVIARGPTYRLFEHLRTITVYVVFQDWPTCFGPLPRQRCAHLEQRPSASRT